MSKTVYVSGTQPIALPVFGSVHCAALPLLPVHLARALGGRHRWHRGQPQ